MSGKRGRGGARGGKKRGGGRGGSSVSMLQRFMQSETAKPANGNEAKVRFCLSRIRTRSCTRGIHCKRCVELLNLHNISGRTWTCSSLSCAWTGRRGAQAAA